MTHDEIYNALLELIQDEKLHSLDDEMSVLNLFEIAGLRKQEIKHSNFLSELFNPNSLLNIGDTVLKSFIRDAFKSVTPNTINTLNPIDFELSDYDNFEVRREYKNIDLLLLNHSDEKSQYCICIENKVDSSESKHQLIKYREIVEHEFSNYKKLYLFLTPNGDDAEWDSEWLTVNYSSIKKGLDKVLNINMLNQDAKLILSHYSKLLEKYVIGQTKLQQLSREIYIKHKSALDFIYEYKPDKLSELNKYIFNWLSKNSVEFGISPLQPSKTRLRFVTPEMTELSNIIIGNGWESNDVICMEVVLTNKSVAFKIVLGKSEDINRRERFLQFMQKELDVKSSSKNFSTIYSKPLYRGNLDECDEIENISRKLMNDIEECIKIKSTKYRKGVKNYLTTII
jgi:hypothetical protein